MPGILPQLSGLQLLAVTLGSGLAAAGCLLGVLWRDLGPDWTEGPYRPKHRLPYREQLRRRVMRRGGQLSPPRSPAAPAAWTITPLRWPGVSPAAPPTGRLDHAAEVL